MPFAVLLLMSLLGVTAMPDEISDIAARLPDKIAGWTKSAPAARYGPQNLSTYIDGGAELYLSYSFQAGLSQKYGGPGDEEIAVDVFAMASSNDAFGVFAHSRESVAAEVGQGSEYAAGLLTFWKDRYYVSILAYPETPAKKEIVYQLGRTIAAAIPREGPLPPIIGLLPPEGLQPESVHYFHHYIWLNSFTFVSNENVLDIAPDTPAALGKYKTPGGTLFLLIVGYPDAARAEAAAAKFRRQILGGAPDDFAAGKDGRWTGLRLRGTLVCAVFGAPSAAAVRELFSKIKDR